MEWEGGGQSQADSTTPTGTHSSKGSTHPYGACSMSSTSRSHQVHAAVSAQCRPKFGHWYYKTESALADFKCKGKPVRSLLVVVPYRRLQDLYAWGLQQHHGPPPSDQDNTVRETPTSCCGWGQGRNDMATKQACGIKQAAGSTAISSATPPLLKLPAGGCIRASACAANASASGEAAGGAPAKGATTLHVQGGGAPSKHLS